MITEEMLCAAAARSCELYTADLESGYNADVLHEFSPAFEKKIRKLKRRADHPAFMAEKVAVKYGNPEAMKSKLMDINAWFLK